jgi:pyruvate-formate lyase-activating enzyme
MGMIYDCNCHCRHCHNRTWRKGTNGDSAAKLPTDLPCYMEIFPIPIAPGILDAKLMGYGRKPRAPLSRLSRFRLRAVSQRISKPSREQESLSYGKVVDSAKIDLSIGRIWLQTCEEHHKTKCTDSKWLFGIEYPDVLRFIDVEEGRVVEKRVPLSQIPNLWL